MSLIHHTETAFECWVRGNHENAKASYRARMHRYRHPRAMAAVPSMERRVLRPRLASIPRRICAWCGMVLCVGSIGAIVTHTICLKCLKLEAAAWGMA